MVRLQVHHTHRRQQPPRLLYRRLAAAGRVDQLQRQQRKAGRGEGVAPTCVRAGEAPAGPSM